MGAFDRTRAAVAAWDAARGEREARFHAALERDAPPSVFAEAEAAEAAELRAFHEAFYADTEGVNSRSHVLTVHPDDPWVRKLIARQP